ncbi:MAG: hypothetical protein LUG47_07900 [Clostridiales bacterium]|nr:hypothetical protein [Clostridiales bacterium]
MNESFAFWEAGDDHLIAYNRRYNYDDLASITYKAPAHIKYTLWTNGIITIYLKDGQHYSMDFPRKDRNRAKQVYLYIKEYIAASKRSKDDSSESADNRKADIQEIKNTVERKKTIRNICATIVVIAFVIYFIWGIFFNSASYSSSDSWKNDANDAGYYEKNGEWYYQGDGQND